MENREQSNCRHFSTSLPAAWTRPAAQSMPAFLPLLFFRGVRKAAGASHDRADPVPHAPISRHDLGVVFGGLHRSDIVTDFLAELGAVLHHPKVNIRFGCL